MVAVRLALHRTMLHRILIMSGRFGPAHAQDMSFDEFVKSDAEIVADLRLTDDASSDSESKSERRKECAQSSLCTQIVFQHDSHFWTDSVLSFFVLF